MLNMKEHYELMAQFEKTAGKYFRLDREPKQDWKRGIIYQHGEANAAFLVFRDGYAYGKLMGRLED